MLSGGSVFPVFCVLVALLEISFWMVVYQFGSLVRECRALLGFIYLHVLTTTVAFGLCIYIDEQMESYVWILLILVARVIDNVPWTLLAKKEDMNLTNKND